jgi:hypothetical protein
VGIGTYSLYSISSGSENVAIGNYSGNSTTSDACVFVGVSAGRFNTTGSFNTAIGSFAGRDSSVGDYNTFIGSYAGSFVTGSENTALGSDALRTGTSLNRCIGIGYKAGTGYNTTNQVNTNTDCIYIGNSAGPLNNATVNEIVIGKDATGNGSNTITLGTSSHQTDIPGTLNINGQITGGSISSQNLRHHRVYYSANPGGGAGWVNILTLLSNVQPSIWRSLFLTIKEVHSPGDGGDKGSGQWVGGFTYNFSQYGGRQVGVHSFARVAGYGGSLTFRMSPVNTSGQPGGAILQVYNYRSSTNNVDMEISWHSHDSFYIS